MSRTNRRELLKTAGQFTAAAAVGIPRPARCAALSGAEEEVPSSTPRHKKEDGEDDWPDVSAESRPWTRWWWPGSAVSEDELARHLDLFHAAGIGGVEITPIYGVKGAEEQAIPFLSPRWMDMLRYTVREARRRGMDVDMITGTGWPFGGPWIGRTEAASKAVLSRLPLNAGAEPASLRAQGALQVAAACSASGETLDITDRVDAAGHISWTPPAGSWTLYALQMAPTGQQVKRAARGGEGPVLDHFAAAALRHYLERFDRAFAPVPPGERPRAFFNDSFEVYGANWTRNLLPEFERRRGYDLRRCLPALMGQDTPERTARVRSDYRETVFELLLEEFTQEWAAWTHRLGARARNQAHGSPGNLLDLYAACDIPETEVFGSTFLSLAGLDPLPGTPRRDAGQGEILVCKLASSAAHVAGKPLCSSESMTWLGEHFKVPLEHAKAEADCLFVTGVNHLFYHGAPFSPASAAWPGWLFYAETHFGPTNTFWRDLPALNHYIARCQSFLQAGRPDHDLLVYLPIHDLWATDAGSRDMLQYLTVHNTESWLDGNLAGLARAAHHLWDRGYAFDFISDRLLEEAASVSGRRLRTKGGEYRALVVAGCSLMPPHTLERILELARQGATVLVVGDLPGDVPGLGRLDERREELRRSLAQVPPLRTLKGGISGRRLDRGRLLVGKDLEPMLELAGIRRESLVDQGLEFIRRSGSAGTDYFLVNLGGKRLDGWLPLSAAARSGLIFDPMRPRRGVGISRPGRGGGTEVYLQLDPGESVLIRALRKTASAPEWRYLEPGGAAMPLEGPWTVDFIEGGPTLPGETSVARLSSWTDWPHDPAALRSFSGTARYRLTFPRPRTASDAWSLDLGDVRHSARVRLNGREQGRVISRPYRVELEDLRDGENLLEIEVTNLMANRIAEMDRRRVPWRRFYFVNIEYREFDASGWEPLPSGLLGPVRLIPMRRVVP